jgi:hypothetical protein
VNYFDFQCVLLQVLFSSVGLELTAFVPRRIGDSAFFVWDTRRYRSDNAAEDDESKTMLGLKQREDFYDWVARVSSFTVRGQNECSQLSVRDHVEQVNETVTWKFVVSSVPVMSLWSQYRFSVPLRTQPQLMCSSPRPRRRHLGRVLD